MLQLHNLKHLCFKRWVKALCLLIQNFYIIYLEKNTLRKCCRKFLKTDDPRNIIDMIDLNTNLLYEHSSFGNVKMEEFDKLKKLNESSIKIENKLGDGSFGEVFKGIMEFNDTNIDVAIKV